MGPPPATALVPLALILLGILTLAAAGLLVGSLAGHDLTLANRVVGGLLAVSAGAVFVGAVQYGFGYAPFVYVVLAAPVVLGGYLFTR